MPSSTGIAPPRCHPPPDGGTLRHVNNSLPGPVSEGSVHGNRSRQPDNWLSALAEPFVTILAHGNGVTHAVVTHWLPVLTSERSVRARGAVPVGHGRVAQRLTPHQVTDLPTARIRQMSVARDWGIIWEEKNTVNRKKLTASYWIVGWFRDIFKSHNKFICLSF